MPGWKDPVPTFRTSILDGYAVCAPISRGVYPIQSHIHAGTEDVVPLEAGYHISLPLRCDLCTDRCCAMTDGQAACNTSQRGRPSLRVQIK